MSQFTIPEGAGDQILAYIRQKSREWSLERMAGRVIEGLADLEQAIRAVPEGRLDALAPGEDWSARFCIQHVCTVNANTATRIAAAIRGLDPLVDSGQAPSDRPGALAHMATAVDNLKAALSGASADDYLDRPWDHPLLGPLDWREWLLTIRVHSKAHAGQIPRLWAG